MIHTINKLFCGNSENINLWVAVFITFSLLCLGTKFRDSFSSFSFERKNLERSN